MKMKNNAEWEKMRDYLWERYDKEEQLKKEKEEIIKKYGWDSEQYSEIKDKIEEYRNDFKYTSGQTRAYWAMGKMLDDDSDELIMDESCFDCSRSDFVNQLRTFGLKTFVCTNRSTALMEDIHGYVNAGCKIVGLCEVERSGWNGIEKIPGIRFEL